MTLDETFCVVRRALRRLRYRLTGFRPTPSPPAPPDKVAFALRKAGVPDELIPKFVEIHTELSGRESYWGLNRIRWGMLFDVVYPSSALESAAVDSFEEDGVWQVVCADVHCSDTLSVDADGRLYWSFQPLYSHYRLYFEGAEPDLAGDDTEIAS